MPCHATKILILSVVLAEIVVSEVAVRPGRLIVIDVIVRAAKIVTDATAHAAMTATDVIVRLVRLVMVIVSVVRRDHLIVTDVIGRLVRLVMVIASVVRPGRLIVIDVIARAAMIVIARVAMTATVPRTHAQMRSADQM
ncbi:MAG: hypothetical protein ACKOBK_02730 [Acidimicrobiaceae bacterium]